MSSELLAAWRGYNMADGTVFYPPEGEAVASIYVRERQRPLEPIRHVIQRLQHVLAPRMNVQSTSAIETLETLEAENGAIVNITGVSKATGAPMEYLIGFVFGDDFYDRIDAYYAVSDKRDEYRRLTRDFIFDYRLNLGHDRERRFYYVPPPGWQCRARGLLAQWFTYDFPKRPSQILVSAARPKTGVEASVMASVMVQHRVANLRTDRADMEPLANPLGLEAYLHHAHGHFRRGSTVTDLLSAVLTDKLYLYSVRLETTAEWMEADRALLLDLARSIRPVPQRSLDVKHLSWMVTD